VTSSRALWLIGLIVLFLVAVLAGAARADALPGESSSAWARTEHGAVRLISATTGTGDEAEITLGLEFALAPGWKVYWRSPGDAGYPPEVDWSASDNLARAQVLWPAPVRFSVLGFDTIGYEGAVTLPIQVTLEYPGRALAARARVDYLTCSDICVPHVADLVLDVAQGPAGASAFAHQIDRYRNQVPRTDGTGGLSIAAVAADPALPSATDGALRVSATSTEPFVDPDIFIEGPAPFAFGSPDALMAADARSVSFRVPVDPNLPEVGAPLTVTLVDGGRSVERTLPLTAPAAVPAGAGGGRALVSILALALVGGLILNLMPCVLPVLSIKLLSAVSHGGRPPGHVRLDFIATAAGIVASFVLLAVVLTAIRMSGGTIGWGMQFQHPWFLIAMTLLVTFFAANLWGVFEIPLPRFVANAGERVGHVRGLSGNFLTGALATLMATPCTAPFVGTAVGFALSRNAFEIIAVFVTMGLGLSLPYLLVAAFPRLATRLPRPGRWMLYLRRALGLALIGTGIWLLSILSAQVGGAAAVAVALVLAAIVALLCGRSVLPARLAGAAPIVIAVLIVVAFGVGSRPTDDSDQAAEVAGVWTAFDAARIPDLVRDDRVVFVNVTADWCLTCRVNERFVLGQDAVRAHLESTDVVAMQADWTRPDEDIARFLARYGRYGIPFDVVYGPGSPDGHVLAELLTKDEVLSAIAVARGAEARAELSRPVDDR
jgi:suppressor for copper-sensitivity B